MSTREALARLSPRAREVFEHWQQSLFCERVPELRGMKFGILLGFAAGQHLAGAIDTLTEADLLALAEVSLNGGRVVDLALERAQRAIGGTDGHA